MNTDIQDIIPEEETVRQHRYFTIKAISIKDCIKACNDKGLKFLNAERQDYFVTRFGVGNDGKAFPRRQNYKEITFAPNSFTWRVKAMEKKQ